jgi:DNA repair protein RadC
MDYTIKDLPESERPREKLEDHGASELTDVELLSIVLRTGTQGKNVKELASEILNSYSLDELSSRELSELKEFEGISRVKAGQLQAVGELSRRMKKAEREKVESLSDVRSMCGDMKFLEEEVLRVFYLSSGNELLEKEEFSGGVSKVGAEPRKIFKTGLS